MSLAIIKSRALLGMHAPEVTVEVHLANGLPSLTIVGLPDMEVRESKDRVRAALQNAGFEIPSRRITINLAPADLPKESGRFDLPIALGILAASGQIQAERLNSYEFAGELSLSGQLRPIRGALAMTLASLNGKRSFILPMANADEAALVTGAAVFPAKTLLDVCAHFSPTEGAAKLARHHSAALSLAPAYPDFSDVKGQIFAKHRLEIAAAGGHSVLLVGPPGSGKTMLASRFVGLLPPMSDKEALESAAVHSLTGKFRPHHWKTRPFRSPHHSCSGIALVGGGSSPRPGEISLAHCGVLFLDELPEFQRSTLEVLRQPMESGVITISRILQQSEFPARFQLIAAMNPCPCGYYGHVSGKCECTPENINRYQARISGPLFDRIDMQIEVAAVDPTSMRHCADGESSTVIAARVARAFQLQLERQGKSNQQLNTHEIDCHCHLDREAEQWLCDSIAKLHWSARAYHRVLRVARTIADLEGSANLKQQHISEAVQCRRALREFTG
jgi:magnesium chelatase family protein